MDSQDFTIKNLGECKFRSPLNISGQKGPGLKGYISDEQRVLTSMQGRSGDTIDRQSSFEVAGPREKIFFKPAYTKAAIVTCGGLCPGINCVIRSLVAQLYAQYGIKNKKTKGSSPRGSEVLTRMLPGANPMQMAGFTAIAVFRWHPIRYLF